MDAVSLIRKLIILLFMIMFSVALCGQEAENRYRFAETGLETGVLEPGELNMITDVPGVKVGHYTLMEGDNVRTGVTAILPHQGNLFIDKVPAAIHCFNGFGKLAGYLQVKELGNIETPVVLTNTLNVGTAVDAVIRYMLQLEGNENVRSVNAVVGETNDGYLNDIRGQHVRAAHVEEAIRRAKGGRVEEGSVGAGTGTVSMGFKSGIGTASRKTPPAGGKSYTVGVLVQSNFGRELIVNGVPVTREILDTRPDTEDDGSCMIIIATDAPVSSRNLERLARRSFNGMARTTRFMSNSSGDFAIAFSTAYRINHTGPVVTEEMPALLSNSAMDGLFQAVEEATREAVYNSLFMAETVEGRDGNRAEALPVDRVIELLKRHNSFKTE